MNHAMFAIRDTCVGSFLLPMFFQNRAGAVRAFGDAVNKAASDNQLYQHPEHFQLFELGLFDDETGLSTMLVAPEFVVDASSLVRNPGG